MYVRPKGNENCQHASQSEAASSTQPSSSNHYPDDKKSSTQHAPAIPPRPVGATGPVSHQPTPSGSRSPLSSVGPQLPPRTIKLAQNEPASGVPPPRPPKSIAPPIPSRSGPAQRPCNVRHTRRPEPVSSSNLDESIARLMEMGYSYEDVYRAMSVAQNNSSVAAQILQNFVPTFT